jgi:hypothetical protein
MCGCEAHRSKVAFCTCNCPEHKSKVKTKEYVQQLQPETD